MLTTILLITVISLVALCGILVFEILYLRKMNNFMIDRYNGLVELSNTLVKESNILSKDYEEALREYVELLTLVQQLLCVTSKEEAKRLSDRIYILVETGVCRKCEVKDSE